MGEKIVPVSAVSGLRVKAFRQHIGLSQQELADAFECAQGTIQRYESGKREPTGALVKFLHEKYKMSYEWYTSGKGSKTDTGIKKSSLTDVNQLKSTIELQELRLQALEDKVSGLIREVYALKHGV